MAEHFAADLYVAQLLHFWLLLMTISAETDPDDDWSHTVAPFVTLVIMQHLDIAQTAIDFTLDAMGERHADLIPLHGLNYDEPIDPFTIHQQEYAFMLQALAEQRALAEQALAEQQALVEQALAEQQALEAQQAVDAQGQYGWLT
jgi:hypothetical protein